MNTQKAGAGYLLCGHAQWEASKDTCHQQQPAHWGVLCPTMGDCACADVAQASPCGLGRCGVTIPQPLRRVVVAEEATGDYRGMTEYLCLYPVKVSCSFVDCSWQCILSNYNNAGRAP